MYYALAQIICDAIGGDKSCSNHFPPNDGAEVAIFNRSELRRAARNAGWKRIAGNATSQAMDVCPECYERIARQAERLLNSHIGRQKGGH